MFFLRAGHAEDARVARVLWLLTDGATYREVAEKVDCSAPFISKWKHWLSTSHEAANRLGRAQGRAKNGEEPCSEINCVSARSR